MPQFRILFYANYTILVTQSGGVAQLPPLNIPLSLDTKIRDSCSRIKISAGIFDPYYYLLDQL